MSIITPEELSKIVELANTVPEEYRQKCFELLLSHALYEKKSSLPTLPPMPPPSLQTPSPIDRSFVLPIDVKAFLSQYGLDESVLWKFFLVDGQEVRPIYQLKVHKKATAQTQHTLMMALENALTSGRFQVDIEALRARCDDQKCYDADNFMKNIRDKAELFKSIAGDEPLTLSPDAKSELADLLEQLKD